MPSTMDKCWTSGFPQYSDAPNDHYHTMTSMQHFSVPAQDFQGTDTAPQTASTSDFFASRENFGTLSAAPHSDYPVLGPSHSSHSVSDQSSGCWDASSRPLGNVEPNCRFTPAMPAASFSSIQLPLITRSTTLLNSLQSLLKFQDEKAKPLYEFYQKHSARIECDRMDHLRKVTAAPTVQPIVNHFFDSLQHALINEVEQQMQSLSHDLPLSHTPCPGYPQATTQTEHNFTLLNPRVQSETLATQVPPYRDVDMPPAKKRKGKALNKVAVDIMNKWYEQNLQHPYPSTDTAEVIAQKGNITAEQVKKWFANKRMRTANTKPAKRRRREIYSPDRNAEVPKRKRIRTLAS